jgi:hypothetical protein
VRDLNHSCGVRFDPAEAVVTIAGGTRIGRQLFDAAEFSLQPDQGEPWRHADEIFGARELRDIVIS